jgi:hypothetical protein
VNRYNCLIIFFISGRLFGQTCVPTTIVSAELCCNKNAQDFNYYANNRGIRATDSSYTIVSFKLKGENLCNEQAEMECVNTGATFNEARPVLIKACPNTVLRFYCIRAKNKKGEIFVLQPFTLKL